ncbi:PadR family transcriptional regulator [Streptomyces uncialis]|uniref:PadR family transcriptional regulator n=1 Tax=Streptomyces uncialis TaxID=1048205 RepID=UPI00340D1FE9
MAFPTRVTRPLLRVLEVFVRASVEDDHELHGWAIKKSAELSGAATYKMLDRLEDAGWVTGHWEEHVPGAPGPPRRLYRLTGAGQAGARAVLAERRPETLRDLTHPAPRPAPRPRPGLPGLPGALGHQLPGGRG